MSTPDYRLGAADVCALLLALPTVLVLVVLGALGLLVALCNLALAAPFLVARMVFLWVFAERGEGPSERPRAPGEVEVPL